MDAQKSSASNSHLGSIDKNLTEWRGLGLIYKDKMFFSLPKIEIDTASMSPSELGSVSKSLNTLIEGASKALSTYVSKKDVTYGVTELSDSLKKISTDSESSIALLKGMAGCFSQAMDSVELVSRLNWLPDINIRDESGRLLLTATNKSGVVHELASVSLNKARYVTLNDQVVDPDSPRSDNIKDFKSDGWLFSNIRPEDIRTESKIDPDFAKRLSRILSDSLVISSARLSGNLSQEAKASISQQINNKWESNFKCPVMSRPGALPDASRQQTAQLLKGKFYVSAPALYDTISTQLLAPNNKIKIRNALEDGFDVMRNGSSELQSAAFIQRELNKDGVTLNSTQILSLQTALSNYSSGNNSPDDIEIMVMKVIKAGDVGMKLDLSTPEIEKKDELNEFSYSPPKLAHR